MRFFLLSFAFLAQAAAPGSIQAVLKNAEGKQVGTAVLTPVAQGVKIQLEAQGLTAGEHAIHFHENGVCQGPKFDSAGGHFAPGKKKHGFDDPEGPHAGDMRNIVAGADGRVKVEFVNSAVVLGKGPNSLTKAGGSALVIHEKADDYKSQPAGNAGARIVCGEIKGT